MMSFWAQVRVIAFRDFKAVAGTPVFILFLLAPLLMAVMGLLGGGGAHYAATLSAQNARIAVIIDPAERPFVAEADARLRPLGIGELGLPELEIIPSHGAVDEDVARALLHKPGTAYEGAMFGPLSAPTILAVSRDRATYLSALADQAARSSRSGLSVDTVFSKPKIELTKERGVTARARLSAGYAAVFVLFLLTLLLSAQTVGTFVEEKSNKVIEILAAATPLEAIFLGKLLGMYGVALLFIGFWCVVGGGGYLAIASASSAGLSGVDLAVGLPLFLTLGLIYFTLSFFLLGAVFLGVGSQAPTVREIQMLSLPITFFEVGMFALASSAASQPGTKLARFAEIFPFSSPFAMAARGATDPALWPHLLAIIWQLLWVIITVRLAAALFRRGVLKSGPGLFSFLRRKKT